MFYVFLADGFEEVEALAPIDILRRAGVEVQTVGIGGKTVTGSHGVSMCADISAEEIQLNKDLQGILLPGGMPGTLNLEKSAQVQSALDYANRENLWICAICAAPSVLGHKGLLKGKNAICFPGFEAELTGAVISENPVCRDGNIITAKGMGVAVELGLEMVAAMVDPVTAEKIRRSIQCA